MKKGITVILALTLALGLGLGGLSIAKNAKNTKEFIADGFILDPSDEEYVTTDTETQYFFAAGAKYKEKFGTKILFKDTTGQDDSIDTKHFIHYNDGSLGAFTKGVIMDVSELSESNYGYYSLTKNTVLIKNGNAYEMKSRGESLNISEYIWKISDTDYMLVSPSSTLTIGSEQVNFPDYVQITYVDNGIVRLSHQQGTYQTVAADSTLTTQGGAELNLVGKNFMVDGEPVLSLDDMSIDDTSYIDVDENVNAPNIPTFNVINGKDGANGTDGTDGEKGEEGEEGEEGKEGEEGEEGTEGTAGVEGVIGTEGTLGKDGVEGDTGIMGYDGRNGAEGKKAENAADASTVASLDLKARPTVSLDTGTDGTASDYKVDANSAQMTFKMDNSANSLIGGQNTTKIKLYDRKTMELVKAEGLDFTSDAVQAAEGAKLEAGDYQAFYKGLKPDTEYLVVVEGQYDITENGGNAVTGELMRKVFKTEPAGIAISKGKVTDTLVDAKVDVTGSLSQYEVRIFYYDENNVEKTAALFGGSTPKGSYEYTVDDTSPAEKTDRYGKEIGFSDVLSNTTYYARLENVKSVSGGAIDTSDSTIELKTLKQSPYDKKVYDDSGATKTKDPITTMQPVLTALEDSHAFKVELEHPIADPDMGITGYRVELYRASDLTGANVDYNNLKPVYTKELKNLSSVTFVMDDGQVPAHQARIVALFDDNEKEQELATKFSNEASMGQKDTSVEVSIILDDPTTTTVQADQIKGKIRIKDGNAMGTGTVNAITDSKVLKYVDATNHLRLAVAGQYHDTYYIDWNDTQIENGGATITPATSGSGNAVQKTNEYWDIPFVINGLHKDTVYSLVVYGPKDVKGDGLDASEGSMRLCGYSVTTGVHKPVAMAFRMINNPGKVFDVQIFTTSLATDTTTEQVAQSKYSANALENVQFELVDISNPASEKVVGTAWKRDNTTGIHTSDFGENVSGGSWVDRSKVANNPEYKHGTPEVVDTDKGIVVTDAGVGAPKFELVPQDFGLSESGIELSGDMYQIRVKTATDYTGSEGFSERGSADPNDVPISDSTAKEDRFTFGISTKHMQALNPNDTFGVDDVQLITNAAAPTTPTNFHDDNLADDTPVGITFMADYGYRDVSEVTYRIYEVENGVDIADNQLIYPKGYVGTDADYAEGYDKKPDDTGRTKLCHLVLKGTVTNAASDYGMKQVYLMFKGNHNGTSAINVTWKDANGNAIPDGTPALERGKRYIVTYTVSAYNNLTSCHPDPANGKHDYPDCAYAQKSDVPLYRSKVLSLNKQTPVVERYPWTSDDNSETWKYRTIDPDNAIVGDSSNMLNIRLYTGTDFATVAAMTTPSTTLTQDALSTYKGTAFKDVRITALGSKTYYKTEIPYKLVDNAAEQTIVSAVMEHLPVTDAGLAKDGLGNYSNIALKGTAADITNSSADIITISGTRYEKSIVNEGNYRYKLTLQGADVPKIAAIRVEVASTTNASHKVIYDPVYLTNFGTSNGVPVANAYIDQGPLKTAGFDDQTGETATVTVKAYYTTNVSGFNEYESRFSDYNDNDYSKKTFRRSDAAIEQERLFALRAYDSTAGTAVYRKLDPSTKNWTNVEANSICGSAFVPGQTGATSGFSMIPDPIVAASPVTGVTLAQRYALDAIVKSSDMEARSLAYTLDATGIHEASGSTYYTVHRLVLSDTANLTYANAANSDDGTIVIGNIMGAIKRDDASGGITAGMTNVAYNMMIEGDKGNGKVYARLFDVENTKFIKVTRKDYGGGGYCLEVDRDGSSNIQYVDGGEDDPYYDSASYGGNYIGVPGDIISSGKFNCLFTGLESNHRYKVTFFTYDSAGNIRPLFSSDAEAINYGYECKTKDKIRMYISGPTYSYDRYDSKTAIFNYRIDGADNGFTIYYKIVEGSDVDGGTALASGALPKHNQGTWYYYENFYGTGGNDPFSIGFNPGTGPLQIGHTYTVKIWALDEAFGGDPYDPTNMNQANNNGEYVISNITPPEPKAPSIRLINGSNNTEIKANVTWGDENKAIINGQIKIGMYDTNDALVEEQTAQFTSAADSGTINNAFSKTVTGSYTLKATAQVDKNNDGTYNEANGDYTIEDTITVNTGNETILGCEPIPSAQKLVANFYDLRNAENLNEILVTLYRVGGAAITSTTWSVDSSEVTAGQFTKEWDWHTYVQEGEQYEIKYTYRNSGAYLGASDNIRVTVPASN